jgi:hypothetical protein
MKKKILFGLVLLLIISGCGDKTENVDIPTITTKELFTGSDGLIVEFVKGNPPAEVYENSFTPITLNIKNKGAYDIQNGIISIALEKDYITAQQNSFNSVNTNTRYEGQEHLSLNIKGKNIETAEGEEDQLNFLANIGELEDMSIEHESGIIISSCYKYQTELSDNICIDTDLFGTKTVEKPCETQSKSYTNQGAPIAIQEVEMAMLPDLDNGVIRPQIIIHIINVGDGEVVADDTSTITKACSSQALEIDKWNKINVEARMGANHIFNCNPSSDSGIAKVTLKERNAKVRCIIENGINIEEGTRAEPLYIKLNYGYTSSISKTIKINKLKP